MPPGDRVDRERGRIDRHRRRRRGRRRAGRDIEPASTPRLRRRRSGLLRRRRRREMGGGSRRPRTCPRAAGGGRCRRTSLNAPPTGDSAGQSGWAGSRRSVRRRPGGGGPRRRGLMRQVGRRIHFRFDFGCRRGRRGDLEHGLALGAAQLGWRGLAQRIGRSQDGHFTVIALMTSLSARNRIPPAGRIGRRPPGRRRHVGRAPPIRPRPGLYQRRAPFVRRIFGPNREKGATDTGPAAGRRFPSLGPGRTRKSPRASGDGHHTMPVR